MPGLPPPFSPSSRSLSQFFFSFPLLNFLWRRLERLRPALMHLRSIMYCCCCGNAGYSWDCTRAWEKTHEHAMQSAVDESENVRRGNESETVKLKRQWPQNFKRSHNVQRWKICACDLPVSCRWSQNRHCSGCRRAKKPLKVSLKVKC